MCHVFFIYAVAKISFKINNLLLLACSIERALEKSAGRRAATQRRGRERKTAGRGKNKDSRGTGMGNI